MFLNGFFLAKGSELGYLGGAAEALVFALLNIGVAFLAGAIGVRELNHRNWLRKLFGLVALLCYLAMAIVLNLTLAHYREVAGALVSDAGQEVLMRLRTDPLGIADVKSWLFFGLGMLCSLIAFGDSYLLFDPYPGYGLLEKRRAGAYDAYIGRKNDLIERLLEIRDEAIEILEEANRDLSVRRGEHDAILESRARLMRLFEAHQSHLDRAANALLSTLSGGQQALAQRRRRRRGSRCPMCSRSSRPSTSRYRRQRATICGSRSRTRRTSWSSRSTPFTPNSNALSRAIAKSTTWSRSSPLRGRTPRPRRRNPGDLRKHVLGGVLAVLALGVLGAGAYVYVTRGAPAGARPRHAVPGRRPALDHRGAARFDRRHPRRRQARDPHRADRHGRGGAGLRAVGDCACSIPSCRAAGRSSPSAIPATAPI